MTSAPSQPAGPGGISALLEWCRALMRQGAAADPAEVAAYQQAKASLLDQIAAARASDGAADRSEGIPQSITDENLKALALVKIAEGWSQGWARHPWMEPGGLMAGSGVSAGGIGDGGNISGIASAGRCAVHAGGLAMEGLRSQSLYERIEHPRSDQLLRDGSVARADAADRAMRRRPGRRWTPFTQRSDKCNR